MSEKNNHPRLGDPLEYSPKEAGSKPDAQTWTGSPVEPGPGNDVHDSPENNAGIQEEAAIRKKDTGLGQPDFEPISQDRQNIKNISHEEMDSLRLDQEDLRRQFEEKLLEFEKTGIRIPVAIYRTVLWIMIFTGAVLGLFMIVQGVRFAGQVSSLAFPWNVLATALFLFFLGIILLVVVMVLKKFLAFKTLARIDLKALNKLAERKRFQQLAQRKKDEARGVLAGYLQDYNINDPRTAVPGLEKADLKKLVLFRQSLMDKKGYVDSARWLREFNESFVHVLDKAARKRIRAYTSTVAVGTAASPVKFIDQMIVLYASLKLIGELLEIYNLRPAFGQSALILSRAIIQAYLSGVIGEQSETGVEAFSDYYESIFGEISFATGISAATDATRFILPKVSEGALNGFLIWRLGRQAQKMLRPL